MSEQQRSHYGCWKGDHYEHDCRVPSGRSCIDCGEPAGTAWGPCWCPDCDVKRLDRITRQLSEMVIGDE